MYRKSTKLIILLVSGILPLVLWVQNSYSGTIIQPTSIEFDVSADFSSPDWSNISGPSLTSEILIDQMLSIDGWYRSTTSSLGTSGVNSEFLLEMQKDTYNAFWDNADFCVHGQLFSLGSQMNGYDYPNLRWVNGHEYRVGSLYWTYGANNVVAATLPSYSAIPLPAGMERPLELRFLASGSNAYNGDDPADYTVTWRYADYSTYIQVITVNGMNDPYRNTSGDGYQVYPGLVMSPASECIYDNVNIDEIVATNPDLSQDLIDITITYGSDLAGPLAISMEYSPFDYLYAFNGTYQGTYVSAPDALYCYAGPYNSIWYGISWTQNVESADVPPVPYGDIGIRVSCGDGITWSPEAYFSSRDEGVVPLEEIFDSVSGGYCSGIYIKYRVDLESFLDVSPILQGITFRYDPDADADGFGVNGHHADGSYGDYDCDDNDSTIYPGAQEIPNDGIDQDCNGSDLVVVPNPLNDTTEFVKQVYRDFLNREAEQAGLDYWVAGIDGGFLTRAQCVESFLLSGEFSGNISPVTRLYFAYFLRIPDYAGLMYWIDQYKAGMGLNAISEQFAQSNEFVNTYGSLTNSEFVTLVYQNVLERTPDQAGLDYWTNLLDIGFSTKGEVMTGFSESVEYIDAAGSKIYVTMTYIGLLRRSPDQAGYNYWVGVMDGGSSGLGLIDGFLQSAEYANRF